MSKLTRKDKIEIYERSKNGETVVSLAKSFNVNKIIFHYLIKRFLYLSYSNILSIFPFSILYTFIYSLKTSFLCDTARTEYSRFFRISEISFSLLISKFATGSYIRNNLILVNHNNKSYIFSL